MNNIIAAIFSQPTLLATSCFIACVATIIHQVISLVQRRTNDYLATEIALMLTLGLLTSISRFTYIVANLGHDMSGSTHLQTNMGAIVDAIFDAYFMLGSLQIALYSIMICLAINIAIIRRTSGSSVPATRCRVR